MSLQLFDLFYALAGTLYSCPASVALSAARMTHAYMNADSVFETCLQAAFASEGLDMLSTRYAIEENPNNSFNSAANKLFNYLSNF